MGKKEKSILEHGKLNISMREWKKEWDCNGHLVSMFIMDNLRKIKDMGLESWEAEMAMWQ